MGMHLGEIVYQMSTMLVPEASSLVLVALGLLLVGMAEWLEAW